MTIVLIRELPAARSTYWLRLKRPPLSTPPRRLFGLSSVGSLAAAATILQKSGKPMRSQGLITAMAEQGLGTSPKGKTPHATLYAAILREIGTKGGDSRFKKVDRGQFEAVK